MENYLAETKLLDYNHPSIQQLIQQRNWLELPEFDKIQQIYNFVKNEIVFGYNERDDYTASEVLAQGYGQCNTKAVLLMALLRAVGIPTRLHGVLLDKGFQKGALTGMAFKLAPNNLNHTWAEAYYSGNWVALEGAIPDDAFYRSVKDKLEHRSNGYFGYAIAARNNSMESFQFTGTDTFSQSLAFIAEIGIFDSPDLFFAKYDNAPNLAKKILFGKILSKRLNRHLQSMRAKAI